MLQSDNEKQRKRTPFLKLRLGDQSKQTKICYRIVYFSYFKCFRLLLKSKGNPRLLSNFVWRTDGRGAGGRRGQTCRREIYFKIVYFYCFKCFWIVLKSKGHARVFQNLFGKGNAPKFWILFGGRLCGYYILMITVPQKQKYITGLFIFTLWNACD